MKEKLTVNKSDINKLIENEISHYRPKLEDMAGGLGADEDRVIDYSQKPEGSGEKTKFELKEPIPELLEYLSKLEEARGILSKVAAKHAEDEVKKRIYHHYKKNQDTCLEMIKEFNIVH
jgi:hypothetical protein